MKKFLFSLIFFLPALSILALNEISSIDDLHGRLASMERYDAAADYSVMLPSATDEITYRVNLQSLANLTDSLAPCEYLIDWSLPTPSGISQGFSAYSSGSHYRYRNQRLQEYHFDWDSIPFLTRDGGVQRNAQFAELLPQFIANQINEITTSPDFEYTFATDARFDGQPACRLEAKKQSQGYVSREITYTFNQVTGMPLRIVIESNPGEISEQQVTVNFLVADHEPLASFSEDALIDRYPDIFEKYRQSNFRVENLAGTALPSFSLPTIKGARYSHERNDRLSAPMILALLDPSVATTAETIKTIRESIDYLPYNVEIIWAFTTNNADAIESLVGEQPLDGEVVLTSAKSLARDTGVNSYPTIIFVNREGIINGVQLGFNKNLPEIVMQKTATM